MSSDLKGVESNQDLNLGKALKQDLTPMPIKIKRYISSEGFWLVIFFIVLLPIIVPELSFLFEFALISSVLLSYINIKTEELLPYKKPISSGDKLDRNEINPANDKPSKPAGVSFFGNIRGSNKEVWFSDSDVRTHCLIFGTTGSGKTELLLSICVNTLNQASGFIYIDGKGDNSLWAKVFSLVAARARLDDLYLINYMTSSIAPNQISTNKISNTMNPLATGNADSLSELIISLLPDGGGDGMWKGRASVFMTALIKALVYLRDNNPSFLLDIDQVRKFFTLQKVIELATNNDKYDIPIEFKDGLEQYVVNLPGYVEGAEASDQPEDVFTQHGFITMQFTETFGLLSDTYGHIMRTQVAEVDFFDIVVQRRILVVLLPALEKSTQNLGNLGRIIIASIKNMMATTLGSLVEGDRADVIETKPTNAPSAYLTIFDEYGYYSVEGAAVMPAQARSLGFFMIFAGQDFQAFKKGSEEESHSIVANCAIKICMKLEDPGETLKIFQDAAGEEKVSELSGYERDTQSVTGNKFTASTNVNITSKNIINVRDLRNQSSGEAHMLYRDTTSRLKMFYANPKLTQETRVNTFLEIKPPDDETTSQLRHSSKIIEGKFQDIIEDPKIYSKTVLSAIDAIGSPEFENIIKISNIAKGLNPVIQGIFTLASYIERVNIIDNEIILKIRENLDEFSINNKKDSESNDDDFDYDDNNENLFESSNSFEDSTNVDFKDGLEKSIRIKKKSLDSIEEKSFSLFEKMNIDFFDLKDKINTIEKIILPSMINKGLIDNHETSNPEISDLIIENTLLDLKSNANPIDNKDLNRKSENIESEIKNIIDSIITDDIDDL
jgi:intracellular multiplication protein IcmO